MHRFFGDVVSAKGTTTYCDVDFAKVVEEGDVLARLCRLDPFFKTFVVDFFVAGDVCSYGFSCEKAV